MPSCSYARLIKIVLLVELVVEVVTAPFNGAVDIVKTGFCTDELPSTITPREYDIDLDFADEFKSVRGRVDIYVEIDKPQIVLNGIKKRLSSACFSEDEVNPSASDGIALHLGKQLEFSPADVEVWTASSIEELREGKGNMVNVSEILRDKIGYGMRMGMIMIRLETNLLLVSGSYARITINYSSSDLSMVYAGEIYDARGSISGQRDYLYHTVHLEQGQARDLFPCFEGPNFKAKTRLTVRQPYVDRRVIANMPLESENTVDEKEAGLANGDVNQYHQTKFHQSSEPIPVSSLAFMIGPEETATNYHKAHSQDSSFTVNVFEPVGHSGEGQFAAEFALKAADWFHNYLNQPEHLQQQQHHHRLKYINLVAVPPNAEWNITHGHNIGLINHEFLLIDESMSSPERKIEVALNVAQVLAHQWFGNLVEPKTPRHLWITQGLAFHLAIQAVDDQMPEFQVRQYVKSNIRPLASGEIISRYSLDIESPCYHKALRGPLNNLRRVRGEQVFELIRANIIGNDDERFGEIIRSLAKDSTRTGGGIDRHELARAFVVDQTKNGYSSEQLGEIISMVVKYGDSKRMLSVRMAAREIVLERHVGTISVWPVNMFVQFNRGTSSLHAPVEVPIGEFEKGNKIIVVKMPDWFDRGPGYKEDWLKVELGEGQLMPYSYIQYSNDLVNRLGKAFQTHRLNKLERIDILNQQIFTLERIIRGEYIPGYIDQLAKVIELYNDELDPDVLLELMRAMDVCDQALSNCSPHYHEQLKHFYKNLNGLKVTGKEWPSLQRAKSRVTGMLVKLEDQEVIDEAIAAFDLGVDKVAAFMRDPIYRAVVGDKKGPNKMERSKRIDILNARWQAVGLAEERSRIMNIIKEIIKH